MEITGDEGKNAEPSQDHLAYLGIQKEKQVVDYKYANDPNIARSVINGVSLIYKIRWQKIRFLTKMVILTR